MDPRIPDVFEEAADNLLLNGWQRNALGAAGGKQCMSGHLHTACRSIDNLPIEEARYSNLFIDAYRTLKALMGLHGSIPIWNDHVAKDEWEVRDAFLLAAKSCRERANPEV